jgi:hypothetical protein
MDPMAKMLRDIADDLSGTRARQPSGPARECLLALMQALRRAATRTEAAKLRANMRRLKEHERQREDAE